MRLLILTQKVDKDDPILGFFHGWIKEFAKHCQSVIVVCLEKGKYNLPNNVQVLSLGKESGSSRIKYFINFYKYIWQERNNYDAVLVHMNPEYVVLGGWLWKLLSKKIALWYTHKAVNLKLRLAVALADIIFTASGKSFRLSSAKVQIVGHGIDIGTFIPAVNKNKNDTFTIINVGRITPGKNQLLLVESVARLPLPVKLLLIGAPAKSADKGYYDAIEKKINADNLKNIVTMVGPIAHGQLAPYYQRADLVVNLSTTGSLDKDVLEAAACNVDVLTSNEAYIGILPADNIAVPNVEAIAKAILDRIKSPRTANLRHLVLADYSLNNLIKSIVEKLG